MKTELKPFNKNKGIEDVSGFNEVACEIFERFLISFEGNEKLIRPVTESYEVEEEWQFIYTDKGSRLAETMRRRLFAVGEAHFPNDECWIEVESSYYQED